MARVLHSQKEDGGDRWAGIAHGKADDKGMKGRRERNIGLHT
jgi:hypothetical protein